MELPKLFSKADFTSTTAASSSEAPQLLNIDKKLSRKIDSLRCIMVLLVVWMHADNIIVNLGQPPAQAWSSRPAGWPADIEVTPALSPGLWLIERFLSNGIGEIAVPLLFLISGLLLFRNFQPTVADYRRKVLSRVRTLLIPYLLWSGIALLTFTVTQHLPWISSTFSRRYLDPFSWSEFFRLLTFEQIPSHLWYIRTLVLYILLSPVILIAVKRGGILLPAAAVSFWLCGFNSEYLEIRGAVFISLAAYLIFHPEAVARLERIPLQLSGTLWLLFSLLKALSDYQTLSASSNNFFWAGSVFAGIITVWNSYPLIGPRIEGFVQSVLPYSFFVFLFHEPLQGALIKAGLKIFGVSVATHLTLFMVTPIIVIAVGYVVARLVAQKMPGLYALLTGGRNTLCEAAFKKPVRPERETSKDYRGRYLPAHRNETLPSEEWVSTLS